MKPETLQIKARIQIARSPAEVYEAIADPVKMSNYFISRSSGRMEEGKELKWSFPEFEDEFPVKVKSLEKNKYISYTWEMDGRDLLVEMNLESRNGDTLVTVTEKEMENNEAGINWLRGNTEGWANFLACLKAYLEYGINLRKGAFDFLKKEQATKTA